MATENQLLMGEARKGEGNPYWKGDKATISSIHCWIRDNFEKINKCEHCGTEEAKISDYADKIADQITQSLK